MILRRWLVLLLGAWACTGSSAQIRPRPNLPARNATLAREARNLAPLAMTDLSRRFLAATAVLPLVKPRVVLCAPERVRCVTSAEASRLPPEDRATLAAQTFDELFFYATRYETPLSYARVLDLIAGAGLPDFKGKRILDYGYGMIGQLRLFAELGADVTGIDVDPMLGALYSEPGDRGAFGDAGGKVTLVTANFPGDESARTQIPGPYDLLIAKNTLKRGYIHPEHPVLAKRRIDAGVDDATFVRLLYERVAPGGLLVIYNICPAPAPPDKPYIPWADGRSPFERGVLEGAGFRVLAFDQDDTVATRKMARALEWDRGEEKIDVDHDLFALYTMARRPP
jgi:SAM-dependent methyltransferase